MVKSFDNVLILAIGVFMLGGSSMAVADDAKAKLTAPGAEVKKLAGDFKFTEGPACDRDGNVYFSDIPNARIHKWSLDGKLSTVRKESGKSNGLYFDTHGNLFACEGGSRQLTKMSPTGDVEVLVDNYQGKKLNSPNDLWLDAKGNLYFTDPRYGNTDDVEQNGMHVYYLAHGSKKVTRVVDNMKRPNGIVGTKDGKLLYVTDEGGNQTFVYNVDKPGSLGERRLIADKGSDGMTLDEHGNLYITNGSVWIYSPEGKLLQEIEGPEKAANVCFGGANRKTLFITARTGFYSIKMRVAGQ